VFDSCFSGGVFETGRAELTPEITQNTIKPVRAMVSSGDQDQKVSDDGTFQRLFLGAIGGEEEFADANKDGFVTGTELGFFLQSRITNLTQSRQTPRYGKLMSLGFDQGDFVFELR
jgi:hypothetical protein